MFTNVIYQKNTFQSLQRATCNGLVSRRQSLSLRRSWRRWVSTKHGPPLLDPTHSLDPPHNYFVYILSLYLHTQKSYYVYKISIT